MFSFKILILIFVFFALLGAGYLYAKYDAVERQNARSRLKASVFDKSISLLLMLFSTFYTFVLGMVMSAFRCYPQEDGTYTLLASPSHDCYDSEWRSYLWIIIFGILLLLYFPVQLLFVFWRYRGRIHSNAFFYRYGVLVMPYKEQYFYWEVVLLIRKLILICLVDLTNAMANSERAFVLICFLILELFLDFLLNPFKEENLHIRELRNIWQCASILFVLSNAILIQSSASLQPSDSQVVQVTFIIFVSCAALYTYVRILILRKIRARSPFFVKYCNWSIKKSQKTFRNSVVPRN
jgi:hypothetical protein